MPPRFTPTTEQALRAAGWFPNRTVSDEQMNDWLVINWCPHFDVPRGYLKISPKAWQALSEFGGLSIERGTKETHHFEINPLLVPDKNSLAFRWDTVAWEFGTDLFPLGMLELNTEERGYSFSSYRPVFMGNDGRVFMQSHPNHYLGNSIEEALERIVAGGLGESLDKIDEAEAKRLISINDKINDLILRREKQLMQGLWPHQATTLSPDKEGDYADLLAITDWDTEAKRVCQAFGIIEPCVFVGPLKGKVLRSIANRHVFNDDYLSLGDDLFLSVLYTSTRIFRIRNNAIRKNMGRVAIGWRGYSNASRGWQGASPRIFAKGLFNLGFLTPEIEATLQLCISHHEKLEWQLEFESLNNST